MFLTVLNYYKIDMVMALSKIFFCHCEIYLRNKNQNKEGDCLNIENRH